MNLLNALGVLSLSALCLACQGTSEKAPQSPTPAIDLTAMDTSISPRDDFFRYANGGWMQRNPLPPTEGRYGSFDVLRDSSRSQVRSIVEELVAQAPTDKGSNEYRVATLYAQAMDSTMRNALGAEPIRPYLADIEAIGSKAEMIEYVAGRDGEFGSSTLFASYVYTDLKDSDTNVFNLRQTRLPLGSRDYYLEDNESMQKIRREYLAYLRRIAELAGYSESEAERMAQSTLRLETEIARFSYSNTELRDTQRNYNMLSVVKFAEANKGFDWLAYFKGRELFVEQANFAQLDFFRAFSRWFEAVDLDQLKDMLTMELISGSANSLSDAFVDARFDFFGKVIGGLKEQKPRWERAVGILNDVLGEALSEVYVKRYFSPKAKERMLVLVENLQKALAERVAALPWMGESTKAKALEKLGSFIVKIGYPDKWRDYSTLHIDETNIYTENLLEAARYAQRDNMERLGKPVDRSEWLMNAHEVNAYYNPTTNEICFPAGILQPPFFNVNADDAVNYGAIGVVIGHEMTHGFDDEGSNFDAKGNMVNWWTKEDAEQFRHSTKLLSAQFSRNELLPGLFANGELTLGENIADQGGIAVAFEALRLAGGDKAEPIDGFTPEQRFFIAYARLWGQNINEAEIRRLTKIDPHSLGELRVNQALKNIPAFHTAFGTKPGDKMYLAPEERIAVW